MIEYIIQMIFFITIWTLGWKIATADDMVLESVGKWGKQKVDDGNKLYEGLISCEWCVPNIHGLIFVYPLCFALGVMPDMAWWKFILAYPFCLAGSSFASGMLWGWYLFRNKKSDYYESATKYYDNAEELAHFEIKDRKEKYRSKNGKVNG